MESLRHDIKSMDLIPNRTGYDENLLSKLRQGKSIRYCIPKDAPERVIAINWFKIFLKKKKKKNPPLKSILFLEYMLSLYLLSSF